MNIKKYTDFKKVNEELGGTPKKTHYQIGDVLMLIDLPRKKGNGEELKINGPGEIVEISKAPNGDIKYAVLVDMEMDYASPYGSTWKEDTATWNVFHEGDKEFFNLSNSVKESLNEEYFGVNPQLLRQMVKLSNNSRLTQEAALILTEILDEGQLQRIMDWFYHANRK